jgi:hypothetical protein
MTMMKKASEVFGAVSTEVMKLTLAADALPNDRPIAELTPALESLQRAISRVQTFIAMHPDVTKGDPVPAGSVPDDDALDAFMDVATLEAALRLPSASTTVTLAAEPLGDGSPEDALRHWLDGRTLVLKPSGTGYVGDANMLAAMLAEGFLAPADDDVDPNPPTASDTPARDTLRKTFGPREENA